MAALATKEPSQGRGNREQQRYDIAPQTGKPIEERANSPQLNEAEENGQQHKCHHRCRGVREGALQDTNAVKKDAAH